MKTKRKPKPDLDLALLSLLDDIDDGIEYPDAHHRVTALYGLTATTPYNSNLVEANMLVQLPDDAVSVGYREVRPYHFEQVFRSESADFTGTEREFIQNGYAYGYIQTDEYTRHVLKPCSRAGTSY